MKLNIYAHDPERMKTDPHYPIYKLGLKAGYTEAMNVALTHLETSFMEAADRPDRGTPEYEAILKVTRDLASKLRAEAPTNGQ